MRAVVVLLILPTLISGYELGAGLEACKDLKPLHFAGSSIPPSQSFPSPFSINVQDKTYTANQQIKVTLRGECGRTFKGFLIQARAADPDVADNATVGFGTFASSDPLVQKRCEGDFAMTHNSKDEKKSLEVTWTAPSSPQGHIVFVVTFVEGYSVFWIKQRSVIVRDASITGDSPTYTGVPSAVLEDCPVAGKITKPDGCGDSMGCFHDCENNDCKNLVTWQNHETHVEFEIKVNFPGISNGYVAIGFSDDTRMGSDGVTECVYLNDAVSVHNSKNDGRQNLRMSSTLVAEPSGTYEDGILSCTFEIPKAISEDLLKVETRRYLLLAKGRSVSANNINKHSESPLVSSEMVDFTKHQEINAAAGKDTLIIVHGCLMVVAWIFAASLGVIIARYFKPQWPESTCGGQKVWFQLHRSFMMLVCAAGIAAFVIIFVEVQGYSDLGQEAYKRAHPILGIIVTALMVINPIMALFRPHPGDANRPIFNWAHFGVGSAAHILAVVTIFLGVNLGRPNIPGYVTWILVGYVAWQILIEFLLIFIRCTAESKDRSESYELSQKGVQVDRYKTPHTEKSSPVRQVLLLAHIVAITAFTTAIIVIIVISRNTDADH